MILRKSVHYSTHVLTIRCNKIFFVLRKLFVVVQVTIRLLFFTNNWIQNFQKTSKKYTYIVHILLTMYPTQAARDVTRNWTKKEDSSLRLKRHWHCDSRVTCQVSRRRRS